MRINLLTLNGPVEARAAVGLNMATIKAGMALGAGENYRMNIPMLLSRCWDVINSKFVISIVAIIGTSIVGSCITNSYQNSAWERDKEYEILRSEIQESTLVLEEINKRISERAYALQKIYWYLEADNIKEANKSYAKYAAIKDEWNINIRIYKYKIERLINEDMACSLLDDANVCNLRKKQCLHSYFVAAHNNIREWLKKANANSGDCGEVQKRAYEALRDLYEQVDQFIDASYSIFLKDYNVINRRSRG